MEIKELQKDKNLFIISFTIYNDVNMGCVINCNEENLPNMLLQIKEKNPYFCDIKYIVQLSKMCGLSDDLKVDVEEILLYLKAKVVGLKNNDYYIEPNF